MERVSRLPLLFLTAAIGLAGDDISVQALVARLGEAAIDKGTAWAGEGPDFIWAVKAASQPALYVDDRPGPATKRIPGSNLWYAAGQVLPVGRLHSFYYLVEGQKFGGVTGVPAFTPDAYGRPGVPQGKLSEKRVFTSRIYNGMKCDYWVYVPARYDPKIPAALMVWQDAVFYIDRDSPTVRILNVLDNLIEQNKIPVMIGVFISPGTLTKADGGDAYVSSYEDLKRLALGTGRPAPPPDKPVSIRSIEYDTVSDRYARFLRDELLAEVQGRYNIRKDASSRAITGLSSGGICAFNVAWQQPDQFSRVLSWIGSFAAIQWHPGVIDGGNVYPNKVRLEPKRNMRVWLQDGANDVEGPFGGWPTQNIQMANSLKLREYDFHFSFGTGTHNPAHGSAEFPEEMTWLWRGYDASKTELTYAMDATEQSRPFFRVGSLNRETQ
jgi:enterochelin esterase-like enzyme